MLALTKHCMGLNEEALKNCEKAIELRGYNEDSFDALGTIQSAMGLINEAISSYKEAIDINPLYIYSYINLNRSYRKQKNYDDAIEIMEEAIELNPGYADFYYFLAITQDDLNLTRPSLQNFEKFMSLVNQKSKRKQQYIEYTENRIEEIKSEIQD